MLDSLSRLNPLAHNAFRIAVGFMFWTHGGQKLFAWFGRDEAVDLATRFGVAGILEFFLAPLIIVGLFTRPVAFILAGEMAVAYFWAHSIGRGSLWHWANGGELAAVYCFCFLLLSTLGAGSFSLDAWLTERRKRADAIPSA